MGSGFGSSVGRGVTGTVVGTGEMLVGSGVEEFPQAVSRIERTKTIRLIITTFLFMVSSNISLMMINKQKIPVSDREGTWVSTYT
jgi:hypothetical protein